MKIALVSEHANPLAPPGSADAGGQNVHVAALAHGLAERGHTVTVYTRRDDSATPTRVPLAPGIDVVHLTAGPAERIPKDELLPHMGALADELAAAWTLDPPDIVHSHFWMSGLASLGALRLLRPVARPPLAHTFHALGSVKRRHQGAADTSPPERERLEPLVGRRADAVIATCPDEVAELAALGIPEFRTRIAPCGVDPELFRPDGAAEPAGARTRLLSVGRLVPRKGVDLVIRALGLLSERGIDDVELEIVGTGDDPDGVDPERDRLAGLARALGVADRVHLRGRVPRDRMPALLRSADAVVCTPWYEPFGIVPLESMACGTPVIVAATGGLQHSVVDRVTGLHVPPRNASALADAVEHLRRNPRIARSLGRAGRARVESEYAWTQVCERTEAIYRELVVSAPEALAPLAEVSR